MEKRACVCYIRIKNKILLLNRNFEPYGWCLVGGHIEEMNETPDQAMEREIFEETGLKLSFILVGESIAQNGTMVYVYRSDIDELPKIELSGEHSGYMIHDLPTKDNVILAGNTAKFIDIAENSNKCISWHDKITFGKYEGKTFLEISKINASYINWLDDKKIIDINKFANIGELSPFSYICNQIVKQRNAFLMREYYNTIEEGSVDNMETGVRVERDGYYERVYVDGVLKEEHEHDGWGIRTGFSRYH